MTHRGYSSGIVSDATEIESVLLKVRGQLELSTQIADRGHQILETVIRDDPSQNSN